MNQTPSATPFAAVSDELVYLEQLLRQAQQMSADALDNALPPPDGTQAGLETSPLLALAQLWPDALDKVSDLRRHLDGIGFLYDTTRRLTQNLPLRAVLDLLVDTLWRQQYSFIVVLLGETELGPYVYQEMRGVVDPLRFLGKQCPLPLWGELAHALVRRLNPDENDYLIISDLADETRPKPQEFPWLERQGSLMIMPLRKDNIAMGALLLGRREPNGFDSSELCTELVEIAGSAAMALYHAQVRQELQERSDQLVGLQLFTRSLSPADPIVGIITATIDGIADLLNNVHVFLLLLHRAFAELSSLDPGENYTNIPWADLCVLTNRASADRDFLKPALYRLVMWTIEAGQPLFFDPQHEAPEPEDLYYNEVGRALLVPVTSGDDALGVIFAIAPQNGADFDESDIVVVRTVANTIATMLKLALAVYPR